MMHQYPYHVCMQYLHRYVRVQMNDGKVYEGFIANVDQEKVTLAIPAPEKEGEHRQFFGTFGGFFPYGRFFPLGLPLAGLGGIYPLGFFI
ncbi:phosphatidylinositol kinase [Ferviditalea candida]|uniref:Phosphatidylinositol kinase n=1 Tax=Ferviditalea candida TaxID=3108399 RepID=A0ABU5ZPD2_9BACL|nr:phosphatidylinositol kinase [Paenibacillaceae bacterium T2]